MKPQNGYQTSAIKQLGPVTKFTKSLYASVFKIVLKVSSQFTNVNGYKLWWEKIICN